ncbi:hypothetical protein CYFUS_006732 [Cystobacter fuscus]|uniref:Uncharacterized protein n=1 Tax=Cystobacter fuscus TaxID=43 RepID=A0A250JCN1_9BACT|nr:hypothetical protein CYFUS_006732 [Cystobacter fuscus]
MACGSSEPLQDQAPNALSAQGQALQACPAKNRSLTGQGTCSTCHSCGDGLCTTDESELTCPRDCYCGDGQCVGETVDTCPKDCGCPHPPGTCNGCHMGLTADTSAGACTRAPATKAASPLEQLSFPARLRF